MFIFYKIFLLIVAATLASSLKNQAFTQSKPAKPIRKSGLRVEPVPSKRLVNIWINNHLFTSYRYSDEIMKPVLWPIYASQNVAVTRGFPISPKAGERIDHPHHVGLWFNHGDVNNHDFWNNSLQIGKEHSGPFGKIVHTRINNYHSGPTKGDLVVHSEWLDKEGKVLIDEKTIFLFESMGAIRSITRIAELKARTDTVRFKDNKEGLLGLRVARFLEHPSNKPEQFIDKNGQVTDVPILNNFGVTGMYSNSEGITGEQVWGKRAKWMNLKGFSGKDSTGIILFDHPSNPGFPTHWHARGYGLFSANGLGARVFSEGKEHLDLVLLPGETKQFSYKMYIWSQTVPSNDFINKLYSEWEEMNSETLLKLNDY